MIKGYINGLKLFMIIHLEDELGEKMRGVGLIFEKYCKFIPDVGEGVHLLDE